VTAAPLIAAARDAARDVTAVTLEPAMSVIVNINARNCFLFILANLSLVFSSLYINKSAFRINPEILPALPVLHSPVTLLMQVISFKP
jgi:hypothetical protein